MPPDLLIVSITTVILQLSELLHRHKIGPLFRTYTSLPFRDRFDWDRRALNLTFQFLQLFFNAYLLTLDTAVISDCLYGYSDLAHIGFLVIIAFYIYDTTGMIMHPRPATLAPMWIFHHYLAVGLLLFNVCYQRTSAYPAAVFLISAAGHIPSEFRWLYAAMRVNNRFLLKTSNLVVAVIAFLTCGIPPPYLLVKASRQLHISVWQLVTQRMRPYCTFFFSLIYVPHVILVLHQFKRAYDDWGKVPEPFRMAKMD